MNLRIKPRLVAVVAVAASTAIFGVPSSASAGIIATYGKAKLFLQAPDSVVLNAWEAKKVRVFQEQEAFLLDESIAIDFSEPGWYRNHPMLNQGSLEAGTLVNS